MQPPVLSPEVPLQKAIDAFWAAVPPTWNVIRGNLRSLAEQDYAISVEQFHVLRHIRRGVASVSQLADVKQISRSAISQAVDLLVERGLVARLQNAQDRRNIPLELTPAGNRLLDSIWEQNRRWMESRLSNLSAEELAIISSAMAILSKSFLE